MKERVGAPAPLLPFLFASLGAHALVAYVVPETRVEEPRMDVARQRAAVRVVFATPQPEPLPEPPPELELEPEPLPEREVPPLLEPPPRPVREPRPIPMEVPDARPIPRPPPEPIALPEPVPPRAQVEPLPTPQPTVPLREDVPEETPEPPQAGDAAEDQAALEVEAAPDSAYAPKPKYPRKARVRRLEGTVMLSVDVSAAGRPTAVHVSESSGHAVLDEAAVQTVRTWRFKPGRRGAQAVASTARVPITFRLVD